MVLKQSRETTSIKFVIVGSPFTTQNSATYAKSDLQVSRIFSHIHVVGYFPMLQRTERVKS